MAIYSGTFTRYEKLAASKLNSMVTDINAHVHDDRYYTESEVDTKVSGAMPIGTIVLWYSSVGSIPTNWALCDGGTVGAYTTPDLRDRFVVGAGSTYNPADTGGESTHTLTTAEMPSHTHTIDRSGSGAGADRVSTGVGSTSGTNTGSTGSNNAHENKPPYYALCYIMKVA